MYGSIRLSVLACRTKIQWLVLPRPVPQRSQMHFSSGKLPAPPKYFCLACLLCTPNGNSLGDVAIILLNQALSIDAVAVLGRTARDDRLD